MTTTHTLNIHFWLKRTSIKKDGTTPIYARIWIDSRPIDISARLSVLEEHWCNKANRARTRIKNSKNLNDLLDGICSNIKSAYQQLKEEGRPITAQAVKSRYSGKDKAVLTCRDLMDYHREYELKKLAPGTAKNYGATEKYICRFIKKEYKSDDVYLVHLDYSFVVKFEGYLRSTRPLKKSQPLNNNGLMKHVERLQKFTTLALKHGWIKTNPFALYQLKFAEFDCAFLEQDELDTMALLSIEKPSLLLVRDVFIFSCYTGLSYIEIKNLKRPDIRNRYKPSGPEKLTIIQNLNYCVRHRSILPCSFLTAP